MRHAAALGAVAAWVAWEFGAAAVPAHAASTTTDWGPASDVGAIHEIELGIDQQILDPQASVTSVTVSGGYALVGWKTPRSSGQSLYCRTSLGWNRIAFAGTPFDVVGLIGSGVPSQEVDVLKAHVPGGLAASSGIPTTRFRKLTERCL
jgi:hypothetical protein